MQLGDGNNTTSPRAVVVAIVIFLLVAFSGLAGCGTTGGGLHTTRFLFVSDTGNNRVLIYETPFSTGESASVVLGETGFTTATVALTAARMSQPYATAEDSAGNIYVSDSLGQPDFVTGTPNTTQNGLGATVPFFGGPTGLVFDGSGNLWVVMWIGDTDNSRVLLFQSPFANGMSASLALGRPVSRLALRLRLRTGCRGLLGSHLTVAATLGSRITTTTGRWASRLRSATTRTQAW